MRTSRTRGLLAATMLAMAAVAAACVPPGTPPSTTTTTAPQHVVVHVSPGATPAPVTVEPGETVTVVGSGFTTTANLGTRPPLAGKPAGVYVTFGRFADTWKPSQGAPSSARQILEQMWALPSASFDALGGIEGLVEMGLGGTFSVELTAAHADGTNPNYGIAIYPGSGSSNPIEELFVPVTLG